MSPLALRRRLTRLRGSLAGFACVLAISAAVIAHHSDLPVGHGAMDMHDAAAMVMCLGVLAVALTVAALPALRRLSLRRAPLRVTALEWILPAAGAHPSRAGPPVFLRLAVLRR